MDTSGQQPGDAQEGEPGQANPARQALVDEYNCWASTAAQDKDIKLQQTVDEEGKTRLEFRLDSRQDFTLHCPLNYPEYRSDDENFFVEAKCDLSAWCNALNEYLLDTAGVLTLSDILDKGLSLYSSADQRAASAGASKASASDEDDNEDDEDDEDDVDAADDEDCDVEMYEEDDVSLTADEILLFQSLEIL